MITPSSKHSYTYVQYELHYVNKIHFYNMNETENADILHSGLDSEIYPRNFKLKKIFVIRVMSGCDLQFLTDK